MHSNARNPVPKEKPYPSLGLLWLLLACVLVLIIGITTSRQRQPPSPTGSSITARSAAPSGGAGSSFSVVRPIKRVANQPTAEEIVARRLKLFSRQQRKLTHKLADYHKLEVPPDVERFFDALDAGDFTEAQRLYRLLRDDPNNSLPHDESLRKFWRPILEAYGAAEQAQLWPAQQFLDYGNNILNSLQPGMVYVGGTDPGCFICTMLNATTDGEQHITLTQNALADSTYLAYLRASGDGSLNIPSDADQQAAMEQYLQDATQRLQHDQQFPDEPKQLLPGEDVTMTDGKVNVSGQVAIMTINNLLVQDLLKLNPSLSFGVEESFPVVAGYPGAVPLGPVVALNACGGGSPGAITPEGANQAVNYWQNMAQTLSSTPDASGSPATMLSYAHDAAAQGNLLANNNYPSQAIQAYQTALAMSPDCGDAVEGLAKVLVGQGQIEAANQALDNFVQSNPKQAQSINSFRAFYVVDKP